MPTNTPGASGIAMGSFNTKNIIEDFMKSEYEEGLRNEFSTMEALINHLPKDTISGKKKYKSFALGITDNVRALGRTNDTYEIGFDGFYNKGRETVDAEFDTTKLMATFSITDEAILKGTGDGSMIDVLKDSLDTMELNLKVTMNRYTYGSHNGKIGDITKIALFNIGAITDAGEKPLWNLPNNKYYGKEADGTPRQIPTVLRVTMTNSGCLLPGMGVLVIDETGHFLFSGTIWQKINDSIYQEDLLIFVDKVMTDNLTFTPTTPSTDAVNNLFKYLTKATSASTDMTAVTEKSAICHSRQLQEGASVTPKDEYHGLEDIVMTQDNFIFGVNRAAYKTLNCTVFKPETNKTGGSYYLGEELLRDMADHLALTSPEGTSVSLVASTHRVISGIEKSMYQFKEYSMDTTQNGYNLGGRNEIRFDNFILYKDKFARKDAYGSYVYMLDQAKIGELVRRDFQWITSGEVNGILQRRPGTELYEGIMNKYADMYIDAWKCHGAFKGVKEPGVGEAVPTQYAPIPTTTNG